MREDDFDQDAQSFIVRVWREAARGKGKAAIWRGSIIHVGSGNRVYFHNLDSIKHFVQQWAGIAASPPPGWFSKFLGRFNHR